uniref:Ribonuclease H-like domain-containing protein n=1 Tax=Tanacetum cinerariifolium TaxID=118510 RepID=A0A699IM64_TANCI|nr:ribonuclease H-like domain-containing protein [Tanacetum cinerariifolium]
MWFKKDDLAFTFGLTAAVLTFGLAILVDDVEFCSAALTNTCPDLVATAVGTKHSFEQDCTSEFDEFAEYEEWAISAKFVDLKWQVAMITLRVKKFMKKTGRNINFNGKQPVGFDKTKAEFYNCHKTGHFARECRAPRNQGNKSADNERRVVPVETPASALVVQDGLGGYD